MDASPAQRMQQPRTQPPCPRALDSKCTRAPPPRRRSVREMIGGYAANSTATLLATSDEGQEAIQRRQLLVKATDSLSMLVGNVGGAAALGRF